MSRVTCHMSRVTCHVSHVRAPWWPACSSPSSPPWQCWACSLCGSLSSLDTDTWAKQGTSHKPDIRLYHLKFKFRVATCTGTSCDGSGSDDSGGLGGNLGTNSPTYRHAPAQARDLITLHVSCISLSNFVCFDLIVQTIVAVNRDEPDKQGSPRINLM